MSIDLAVVDPVHGELVDLASASSDRLGQLLLDVRDHESRLRELKQQVAGELHARWDRARQWSETTESGLRLSGKSDQPTVEWDTEGLLEELDRMVTEGLLDRAAVARAVQERVEYKVLAAGVNALMKSPELAERLEPYRRLAPTENRHVSVSRT